MARVPFPSVAPSQGLIWYTDRGRRAEILERLFAEGERL